MKLSTQVAHNTIIQIISKVISTVLGLMAVAIMTRYLGQFGFGQYTTIMTFLSFFAIAADLGLTLVTSQMLSRPDIDQEKAIGNLFSLRFLTALLFLGVAPLAVFFFPYDLTIKIGVVITTFSFFFAALNQIFVGLFQKKLHMEKVALAEVVSRIFLVFGVWLAASLNYKLFGMMAATVAASAVSFAIHYWYSRSYAKVRFMVDRDIWRHIIRMSWPIAITIIFNMIYMKADTLILSLVKTQEEVGIYGAAYKVIDVLVTIPFMFAGIILPILTSDWLVANKEKFNKVMQRSFDAMAIVAIPLIVGTQFVASGLMTLVAGKEFGISGQVLQILIIAASIIFIGCIFAHAVIAVNKQKQIIWAYVFTSLTSLAGYLIFIPKFSFYGAAWMTVYSELAIAVASYLLVRKYTSFRPNLRIAGKSFLASLFMGGAIYLSLIIFPHINVLLVVSLGFLVYGLFLYFFKAITKHDIMEIVGNKN